MFINKKILVILVLFFCTILAFSWPNDNHIFQIINSAFFVFASLTIGLYNKSLTLRNCIFAFLTNILLFTIVICSNALFNNYQVFFTGLVLYYFFYAFVFKNGKINNDFAFYLVILSIGIPLTLIIPGLIKFGAKRIIPRDFASLIALLFYWMINKISRKYILNIVAYIIFSLFASFFIYPQYVYYLEGKKSNVKIDMNIVFSDSIGRDISLNTLPQKVIVLDFWYSRCGVCFEGFPKYDAFFKKYKNNNDVLISVCNVPISVDNDSTAFTDVKDYSFNKYKIRLSMDEMKKLGITKYPTLLVFDFNRNLRYNGMINYEGGINSIDAIIEDILKEK